MAAPTGLISYRGAVLKEWIDRNGHMSTRTYGIVGEDSMKGLFAAIRLSRDDAIPGIGSFFQGEIHNRFERELLLGNAIAAHSWIIAYSPRWVHHYHEIWETGTPYRAATIEKMTIHIDPASRRAAPMPPAALEALAAFIAAHPRPARANIGRHVGQRA